MKAELRKATISSAKWVSLLQLVHQISAVVVNVVLARLLVPEDFGLVALTTIVISVLVTLVEMGFNAALVQRKDIHDAHLSSAFFVNLLSALLMMGATLVGAGVVAGFYGEPQLTSLLQVFSLSFLIRATISTQQALFERNLEFRTVSIITMVASLAGVVAKIALAMNHFGPWSIILGELLSQMLISVLFWFKSSWRFSWRKVNLTSIRELFAYSGFITAMNLVNNVGGKLDVLVAGKLISPVQLGQYSLAFTLATFLPNQVNTVIQRVMFPSFSRIQHDRAKTLEIYFEANKYLSLATVPLVIGIVCTAPELVSILLGPKWEPIVPIFQILGLYALSNSLGGALGGQILKAQGRAGIALALSVSKIALLLPFILIGSRWAGVGIASAVALYGWAFRYINQVIVNRVLQIPMSAYWASVRPAMVNTSLMVVALMALRFSMRDFGLPDWAKLALLVSVGALVYVGCLWVWNRAELKRLLRVASPRSA